MHRDRLLIIVSIALILAPFGCSRQQEKPVTASPPAVIEVATATTVLATIADEEKPLQPIPGHGLEPASRDHQASFQVIFCESGRGVAYLAEKDGKVYVVHNGRRGKEYASVGTVVLSFDGQRIAYAALEDGKWRMVIDGKEGRPYDTLLTPVFSPDCQHVAYQAKEGDKYYIVVDNMPNTGTMASYTAPEFNSYSTKIAYVETAASSSDMKLIVSDLKHSKQNVKWSIGDLLFTTNKDKTRIAAAQVVGNKLRIIDFSFAKPDVIHEGPLYDVIEQLTLSDDGALVSYCALRGRKRLIVLDSREESLPDGRLQELPVVRPDKKGVGVLLFSQDRFYLHQAFVDGEEKGKKYDEATNLIYSKEARLHAYAARKDESWFAVVNGIEGPKYDRVVAPKFSPDGNYLVYRARKDGKRFVVVANASGKVLRHHPAYEQVYDVQFTSDGSIAYGVKDGKQLLWKVERL